MSIHHQIILLFLLWGWLAFIGLAVLTYDWIKRRRNRK